MRCMPDFMCFNEETDPVKSLSGRTVLDKTEKETSRACEVACGDNDLVSDIFLTLILQVT